MKQVSKGLKVTSRICGATLLAAFAANLKTRPGHLRLLHRPLRPFRSFMDR